MNQPIKERPILFSSPMIRAILDGKKTQTRRVVKPQPDILNGTFEFSGEAKDAWPEPDVMIAYTPSGKFGVCNPPYFKMPYGKPGDRLWVRETWGILNSQWSPVNENPHADVIGKMTCGQFASYAVKGFGCHIVYRADHATGNDGPGVIKWNPSIFLPRWASRITLEIADVRVERLRDITEDDAAVEGVGKQFRMSVKVGKVGLDERIPSSFRGGFANTWDEINGSKYHWSTNPFVWAITFRRITA